MKNGIIQALADCISVCRSCSLDTWMKKEELSKEDHECARMWNDCANICDTCMHFISRGSPYSTELLLMCATICDDCAKECSKHSDTICSKAAAACKKCCDACKKCVSENPRKTA